MRIKTQMYAHFLNNMGFNTLIFSASTIHNTNVNLITSNERYIIRKYDDLEFVHIKCSNYKKNGIERIINMQEFPRRFKIISKEFLKPDAIVADVNCTNYKPIYNFCKTNKIKFIVEVRDLWPDSIVEYLGYSQNNPIIQFLYHREKEMYKLADSIVFSMEGGRQYIVDKKWDQQEHNGPIDLNKVHYINNGVDLEAFQYNIENNKLDDIDLDDSRTFKVVYVGSIRRVNNLDMIVDVAKEIQRENENVRFLIYGDGDERFSCQKRCRLENINNIFFKGKVEKKYIPYILSRCDLNLMHGVSEKLGKYGLSLNKSFDYLASGHPILTDVKANYDYIIENGAGMAVLCSVDEIKNGVLDFAEMDTDKLNQYGACAKKTAKKFDFKNLTNQLFEIIEE